MCNELHLPLVWLFGCLSSFASPLVGGQYQAVKVMHAMFTQARTVRVDEVAAPRKRRSAHTPLDALNQGDVLGLQQGVDKADCLLLRVGGS